VPNGSPIELGDQGELRLHRRPETGDQASFDGATEGSIMDGLDRAVIRCLFGPDLEHERTPEGTDRCG
jgi:hypothetical protein